MSSVFPGFRNICLRMAQSINLPISLYHVFFLIYYEDFKHALKVSKSIQ